MSRKRAFDDTMESSTKPASPYMPMFEQFRIELDEHHDRRERVIKASRDITAASKKVIFALQRVRKLNEPLHASVSKASKQYFEIIEKQYTSVSNDVQGLNAYRYSNNLTGGTQEYMEAVTFQHYLETQQLISFNDAQAKVITMSGGTTVMLTVDDYLLGVFDMVGELMRFAITTMATNGELPGGNDRNVLADLRELRTALENLNIKYGTWLSSQVSKKMSVMQTCVEKVEKALYNLTVRGAERPKGWMPDLNEGPAREEVESY